MKKLLLSMVAALTMAFGAAAETASFVAPTASGVTGTKLINADGSDSGANDDEAKSLIGKSFTDNGLTIKFVHGDGQYYSAAFGNHVRLFQGDIIEVTAPEGQTVTKIDCATVANSKGVFKVFKNDTEVGTVTGAGTSASTPIQWTGSVSGSFKLVAQKQVRFSSLIFTFGEGGGEDPNPNPNPDPEPNPDLTGNGTEASPYTAADALAVTSALPADQNSEKVYVKGTISTIKSVSTSYGNAEYYINDGEGTAEFYIFRGYYLNGDKFTAEDQIKVGDVVVVYGALVNYKGNTPEMAQGNQIISINGSTSGGEDPEPGPEPEAVKVNSVKEIIALADDTKFETTFTLQVGFKNNRNVFVCDEAGDFIQIYGDNELNNGDVIPAGLVGAYKLYNGNQPEIVNATIPAATAGTFTPKTVAASAINLDLVNNVVKIAKVELAEATPADQNNFTGTSEGTDLTFRNQYKLESVEAGTYDITVVVTVYQGNVQLYVVAYEKSNSGIADIAAEEAAAEYFNLQGVRIANPAEGQIVIRRQGNKVEKILVK